MTVMGVPREPLYCQLVVAAFSRHPDALDWAQQQLEPVYGAIRRRSPDFDFHHTTYYEPTMGAGLVKRLLVFEPLVAADGLADIKRHAIQLERKLAATNQ